MPHLGRSGDRFKWVNTSGLQWVGFARAGRPALALESPMTWPEVETALANLPPVAVARVTRRATRRSAPAVTLDAAHYGDATSEWFHALSRALDLLETEATPFRLSVGAEVARLVAADLARASRERGPGPRRESAEMAAAAVAFALDAARFPTRAAALTLQSLRASCEGEEPTPELVADLETGGRGELPAGPTPPAGPIL